MSVPFKSNWNLEELVVKERGKLDHPEKSLSEKGREPTTNSIHTWLQRRELNLGHIGGRRVFSPLCHRIVHGQEASNINLTEPLFSPLMFAGFHNQSPWLTMMCVRNEDFFKAITSIFLFILMFLSLVITSFLCLNLCLLSTFFTRWPFVWSRTKNHNSRGIYKQNRLVNIYTTWVFSKS